MPLPPARGSLYLAVVLDAWSRRIVGWAFSAWTIERIREDAHGPSTRLPAPDNRAAPGGICAILVAAEGRAMSETRKIAAILVADAVGYSRLAGADEDRVLSRLRGCAAI